MASTFVHMDSAVEQARWKADSISAGDDAPFGGQDPKDEMARFTVRTISR